MMIEIKGLDLINKLKYKKVSSLTGVYDTQDILIGQKAVHILRFTDDDVFELRDEHHEREVSK
ncbi:hypothetical protein [Liquorilactobacillus satsumensis]|uniref:hypothetical protein n=1 Tax=Liquorilactobacillus satsumensis TaxID=259059 RepID=UPI0039ED8E14